MDRQIAAIDDVEQSPASTDADARAGRLEDLEHLFDLSLDLLCISGLDGYFRRLNPSWTRALGWTEQEFLSRPVFDLLHPDDLEATTHARAGLAEGIPLVGLTNRYRCKDGTYRWLEWRSVSAPARGLVYAAARDVTARREAEEAEAKFHRQLIVTDRLVSVGTLAAGVAHEINNPLSYVIAHLDLAMEELRELALPARTKELVEMLAQARAGADRVHKIVGGLKTFSRADEERGAVMEIQPTLELAISMAFGEIRHRARLVKELGTTPPVFADTARLGQVFLNLLINAAQALPEAGAHEAHEIRVVTSTDEAGRAVVEVRDTGAGIPEDILGRIFDPFFTTKPVGVGTGLGLSICHSIVSAMRGEISVSSVVGRGSTFRVLIPPAVAKPLPAPRAPAVGSSPQRRARILVVDDEPVVASALQRVLRGHEVTVCHDAEQALALIAGGKHFDLIFSDLMMPRMTGMDFHREVAALSPDVAARMVFVTGGAFSPMVKAFLDRVENERVEKPFTLDEIRGLVDRRMK
jgi:PAS domain S-box-containing protein